MIFGVSCLIVGSILLALAVNAWNQAWAEVER